MNEIFTVQDSWVAFNPIVGCSANCVYCFLKPRGKTGVSTTYIENNIEKDYKNLMAFYKRIYCDCSCSGNGISIPIAIGTNTDMFSKKNYPYLCKFLEVHELGNARIPIVIITKIGAPEEFVDIVSKLTFQVIIIYSISLLPDIYERGVPKIYDRIESAARLKCKKDKVFCNNLHLLHNWKPFIETERLEESIKFVEKIKEIFECSMLVGLRITDAMRKQILEDPKNPLYSLAIFEQRSVFDSDEIINGTVYDIFGQIDYPVFRNTSCALAYLFSSPDYTGTMWREDICRQTLCPYEQRLRCKEYKQQWDPNYAKKKLEEFGLSAIRKTDCMELLQECEYGMTIAMTHLCGQPVYFPEQELRMEWYCGNYRYFYNKYYLKRKDNEKTIMEFLDLVNENDIVINSAPRVWIKSNKLHNYRVVNIFFVLDKKVMLAKRSMNTEHFPGMYDFAVGGHVQMGEDYIEAAYREMKEEMGIDNLELKEFFYYRHPNNYGLSSFGKTYYAHVEEGIEYDLGEEIESYEFKDIDDIAKLCNNYPEQFKSDYPILLQRLRSILDNG